MDNQTLLNAVLDTYREEERDKAKLIHEALLKGRQSKLFKNGEFFLDIIELTLNQSRSVPPIYNRGDGIVPIDFVAGRTSVSGKFLAEHNPDKLIDIQDSDNYTIESIMLFEDGKTSKAIIHDVYIDNIKVLVNKTSNRMECNYQATKVVIEGLYGC